MERQLEFEDEGRDDAYRKHIRENPYPLYLILDQLTDPRNLGALFRLADAARISGIYLLNEQPIDLPASAKRASRSTWQRIPFETVADPVLLKESLPALEWVALERTNQSQPYWGNLPAQPTALVLGNESEGVRQQVLDLCSYSVHIPMFGWNSSMNVAMAAGIAVFEWLRTKPAK